MSRSISGSVAWLLLAGLSLAPGSAAETSRRLAEGWEYYQGSLGSVWEIWRGEQASDNVTWTPVTLPHCFNARDAVDPDTRYYQGPGWYRTRVAVANPFSGGRTLLHFEGAGQHSQVFVGLRQVGEHRGGYDEWTVDITEALAAAAAQKDGAVPLAVRCDNSRDAESIPSDLSDFNRYGGLYRHVTLVYVPAVSLERVHVEPALQSAGRATVKVRARLHNPGALKDELELTLVVTDPQDREAHRASQTLAPWNGAREIAAFELATPQCWSPKSPALYRCALTLKSRHGQHTVTERFGVRSVEWVEHGPFKLNGERLLLRGTHYHEDHAGVAAAVPDEVVRQTLRQIKDMGANFVRLGHYQQAALVLDLCDELGLLVWEEIPWCRGGLGGERYRQQCRDMLRNLIDQHYNHPSVILWGLGNENDWPGDFPTFDTNAIRSFMAELNTLAHQLDPSRQTSIRRCEFCKDIVDVYSPSIWAGWYSGRYSEYRQAVEKAIAAFSDIDQAIAGSLVASGTIAEEHRPKRLAEKQIAVDRLLKEGDVVAIDGFSFTVLQTPGHSDCSLSFHDPGKGILIISDATGYYMPRQRAWWPNYFADYGKYVESIRRLAALKAEVLCLSHNGAIRGPGDVAAYFRDCLAATEAYHRRICEQIKAGTPVRQLAEQLGGEIHAQTGVLPVDFFQKNCGILIKQSLRFENIAADK